MSLQDSINNWRELCKTPGGIKRMTDAIADHDKWIAKESARPSDIRPAHVAELLKTYIGKRNAMANFLTEFQASN